MAFNYMCIHIVKLDSKPTGEPGNNRKVKGSSLDALILPCVYPLCPKESGVSSPGIVCSFCVPISC